MAASKAIICIT